MYRFIHIVVFSNHASSAYPCACTHTSNEYQDINKRPHIFSEANEGKLKPKRTKFSKFSKASPCEMVPTKKYILSNNVLEIEDLQL